MYPGKNKHQRELIEKLDKIITEAGGMWRYEAGDPHCKLHVTYNGITRKTPLAHTPARERDTMHLKQRDVKRILRELGASV